MFKAITTIVILSLSILLFNCKNNGATVIDNTKQDSLSALAKSDSQQIAKELNKYLIMPPDTDYTGDYIDKYSNGVIKFTGFFRFGQRHGEWMAFFENGKRWSDCFYDKGKKHGASTVYHPNGKIYYTGWYKNNLRDSLWFFYDSLGKEVDRHAFKNDVETGMVN